MDCEVVVVGGGIGGLTVAALMAQRGVNVCVLERERQLGGCAAPFEKFDYRFEPGYGLFTGWERGGIHERVFSALPVDSPDAYASEPSYVVRLPDASEIKLGRNEEEFEAGLRACFPECAEQAIEFYREAVRIGAAVRAALRKAPDALSQSTARHGLSLFSRNPLPANVRAYQGKTAAQQLHNVSPRFRRFIDLQLQTFTQGNSDEVSFLNAALALSAPLDGMHALRGGAPALVDRLAESITKSGGRIRLNTPVLRLSYGSDGTAVGVDLLSGETVRASKAIVSNLTIWDTYGKLVGLNRTPTEVRKQLNAVSGWGAYLLYLGLDDTATDVPDRVLALTYWEEGDRYTPEHNQFMFAASPVGSSTAPPGKRAVTVHLFTSVEEWFTFHQDESEHDEKDQHRLELAWARLHSALPELGDRIEVIDTATPRTFYELTRRKLGMVGAIPASVAFNHETSLPNLFMIGDTCAGWGAEAITRAAWLLAERLTR